MGPRRVLNLLEPRHFFFEELTVAQCSIVPVIPADDSNDSKNAETTIEVETETQHNIEN